MLRGIEDTRTSLNERAQHPDAVCHRRGCAADTQPIGSEVHDRHLSRRKYVGIEIAAFKREQRFDESDSRSHRAARLHHSATHIRVLVGRPGGHGHSRRVGLAFASDGRGRTARKVQGVETHLGFECEQLTELHTLLRHRLRCKRVRERLVHDLFERQNTFGDGLSAAALVIVHTLRMRVA